METGATAQNGDCVSLCMDRSHPDSPDQPLEDREGIGSFLLTVIKYLTKATYDRVVLAHSLRKQSMMVEKAW